MAGARRPSIAPLWGIMLLDFLLPPSLLVVRALRGEAGMVSEADLADMNPVACTVAALVLVVVLVADGLPIWRRALRACP